MRGATNHAIQRMEERGLSPDLVLRVIEEGVRTWLPFRKAFEYTLRIGNARYTVISAENDGAVITSYMRKLSGKHTCRKPPR